MQIKFASSIFRLMQKSLAMLSTGCQISSYSYPCSKMTKNLRYIQYVLLVISMFLALKCFKMN